MAKERADSTRDKLLESARKLFAEKGFDGTSVKDLADDAGVNISLISYHFQSKEGLYRTCLEEFGSDNLKKARFFLELPNNVEEFKLRLQLFTLFLLETHAEQPDVTKIIHRDMTMPNSLTKEIFENTFFKIFETLLLFFEHGRKIGILRNEINVQMTTSLFFGGLIHSARCDAITSEHFSKSIKDPQYRKDLVEQALQNLMTGIVSRNSEST